MKRSMNRPIRCAIALALFLPASHALAGSGTTAFSINDASVVEGSGNLVFTVTATVPPTSPTSVQFATSNGSAQSGSDYTAASGTLTFNSGVATQTVTVTVSGDAIVEGDETVNVTLSNPNNGATISDALGIGTITNDDTTTVSLPASEADEGDAGSVPVLFSVGLSNPVQGAVNLSFQTADGNNGNATLNATVADNDYVAASGTVGFPSLSIGPQSIQVTVNGDTKVEPDQAFRLSVGIGSLPAGIDPADIVLPAQPAAGTIRNDDGAVVNVGDVIADEGNAANALAFPITLSNPSKTPITVNYAATAGTASAADFTAVSGVFTIPPFTTSTTLPVPINGETLVEPNETINLVLTNPVGGFIGDGTAVGTIRNDDSAVVSVANVTLAEGNTGTAPMTFAVTLSNPVQGTVGVVANSADGANVDPLANATVADNDYQPLSNAPVGFAQGTTSQNVVVQVVGDTDVEPNQDLRVLLSNLAAPAGLPVTLSPAAGIGTITNDDGTVLSIADATVTEGTGGSVTLQFAVTLTAASKAPVTVTVQATGQTATAGSDFTVPPATFTVPANATSANLAITVASDDVVEGNETLQVLLSNPQNATLGDADAIGTITDDDVASLRLGDASAREAAGGAIVMTATLGKPVAQQVTVQYASSTGSATPGVDYTPVSGTLTFAPLATSATITIPLLNDSTIEGNESIIVTLSNPVPGAPLVLLDDAVGSGVIVDDDQPLNVPAGSPMAWLSLLAGIALLAYREHRRAISGH